MRERAYLIAPISKSNAAQNDQVIQELFDWISVSEGRASSNPQQLERLMPSLQIHAWKEDGTAPYWYCGTKSTTAQIYGREFALNATGRSGIPDAEFEATMQQLYGEVHRSHQIACEKISACIWVNRLLMPIHYFRVVFPVEFEMGRFVGILTRFCAGQPLPFPPGHSHSNMRTSPLGEATDDTPSILD